MNSYLLLSFWQSIFEYPEIFVWPILASILVGMLAPLIGSVIVIKRLSFIADTLSHFSLAGITFGALLGHVLSNTIFSGISPVIMGIIFSVSGTFIIEKLRGFYKNYKELSMPIVMSLGAALTGIFIALNHGSTANMTNSLLFGSIFTIKPFDLWIILGMGIAIIAFTAIYYKKIISLCFDETFARISGIRVKALQLSITIILAVFISTTMQMFGVLLIAALMIVPIAASILIGKSFKNTIIIAIVFSEISVLLGIYFSYVFSLPSGSVIVVINVLILFVVMIINNLIQVNRKNKSKNIEIDDNPLIKENIVYETETSITVSTKDIDTTVNNNEKTPNE